MELYNLGKGIVAFTTDRTQGRDMYRINEAIICHFPNLQGRIKSGLYPHQTHTDNVFHITEDFLALPESERKNRLEGIDAIISNVPDVIMGISTADCIPVLLYDPVQRAACAIHAGWRGTVKRITEQAVAQMTAVYGTRPADIIAQIGPGIHLDSFEVGDEVYEAFQQEGFDMQAISKKKEKWHIDLPECNRLQLIAKGIPADHIAVSSICTYQQADRFFSARRLGINSGRIFTSIILRQK